ncbi:beta carbonic anhydrase 1-like [Haliotis rubra]|uniref:beta carbonic anhydrase 1-like n=1 Tax=Haliotis rubra TaxID=36100 RepID=UPI001EE5431E|nr:beta carbonic anhydrase 1-like [Haliotis rubra]
MPGIDKIIKGILHFRRFDRPFMVEEFLRVKADPQPSSVFFTCMDSRVLASRFTTSHVGDNFFIRNAGNLIPNAKHFSYESVTTEPGALELGCIINNIKHVVVCGHSDCKAMNALYGLRHDCHHQVGTPLQMWLKKHGQPTVSKFEKLEAGNNYSGPLTFQGETEKSNFDAYIDPENKFSMADKFSQVNCLQQLQNIASYDFLREKLHRNDVRLHAMWFDIYTGNCFMFSRERKMFVEITEDNYAHLIKDAHSDLH